MDAKRLSRQARRRDSNQTGLQSNVTLLWRRTCPVSGPMTNSAEHNPAPKRAPGSVTPDHGRRRVFSSRSSPISTYNRRFFFSYLFFFFGPLHCALTTRFLPNEGRPFAAWPGHRRGLTGARVLGRCPVCSVQYANARRVFIGQMDVATADDRAAGKP